jgi:hypothetical protein
METFLSYLNTTLISCAATFVATMIFRQKIVDWFTGVPSHLRSGLKQIEAGLLDKVKAYEASLVAQIVPPDPAKAAIAAAAPVAADKPVLPEVAAT